MTKRNWLIFRNNICLSGFYGTLSQAEQFAYDTYGINCRIIPETY